MLRHRRNLLRHPPRFALLSGSALARMASCHLGISGGLSTASPRPPVAATIFPRICSYNPAHSRALLEASEGGAGCGACAFVPCKHGARAARGSALEHNDSTRSVRYRLMATPSAIAGNAPSNGSATPQAVQRRAERREALRSLPKRKGTRMSAVKPRRRAHLAEAPIGAPPPRLCRGDKNPPARRETRGPAVGPSYAADDFAWLYDK